MAAFLVILWFALLLGQLGGIPLSPGVNLYFQDVALSGLILVAAIRYGLLRKLWHLRLTKPIALFAGVGMLSLLANVHVYPVWVIVKGSLYLWRWIAYALFYGVVLVSPFPRRFWFVWLGSFGVVLAAGGLVQFVLYPDLRNLWYLGWDPHYYRVFATLLDPNYVGILLVLTLCLIFSVWRRAWWLAGIVGLALLLTYSRSSYLAILGAIVTAVFCSKRWKEGLFIVLLCLLAIVYVPKPGGDTLSLDRYDSTVSRFQNWGQTIARIGERPVFGFGFNVVPFLDIQEAAALPGRRGAGIDSSILFVGTTTGIVGLVGYAWLVMEQVKLGLRSKHRVLKLLLFTSFAAVGVHSLFVNSLFYPWVMIWLWTLLAIVEKHHLV